MRTEDVSALATALIDKHVGNRVRVRRLTIGISQQDLARRLGLTFQQIQKYEKGANRIGASRLYELAALLGVDVNFFFDGLEDDDGHQEQQDNVIDAFRAASPRFGTREFVDLNRSFQKIRDDRLRQTLLGLIELIAALDEAEGNPHAQPQS